MAFSRTKLASKPTRATRRAEAKALKKKAKLEAKLGAKVTNRANKRAAKQEAAKTKVIAKLQKKSDANQLKIAQTQARAAVEGKTFSTARIKRYLAVARLLAPVVAPILYRAATAGRAKLSATRADRLGVPVAELGNYSGRGGATTARIRAARKSLDTLTATHSDTQTKAFASAVTERLNDLESAVSSAEHMPAARRKAALAAVARELDTIDADTLNRLGVRA